MKNKNLILSLLWESIRSGTIASVVMMPVGFIFKYFGLRVGHYGVKVGQILFGGVPEGVFQALLMAEHFVIGWISTTPLLAILIFAGFRAAPVLQGALYGIAY